MANINHSVCHFVLFVYACCDTHTRRMSRRKLRAVAGDEPLAVELTANSPSLNRSLVLCDHCHKEFFGPGVAAVATATDS